MCLCCRRMPKVGRLALPAKMGRCVKNKKYFLKFFNHNILKLGWAKLVSQEPSAMNLQSKFGCVGAEKKWGLWFCGFLGLPNFELS